MKERKVHYRNADSSSKARESTWGKEARGWIAKLLQEEIITPETKDSFTVGDIMAKLDAKPGNQMPNGYVRYLDSRLYQRRYQLVSSVCQKLARSGELETGTTVNAKGREDVVCYRHAGEQPKYTVLIEGPSVTPELEQVFNSWVKDNLAMFKGLDSILISRGDKKSEQETTTEVSPAAKTTRSARRRAEAN